MKKLNKDSESTTKQPQARGVPADQLQTVTGGALNAYLPLVSNASDSPGAGNIIVIPAGGGSGGTPGRA